MNSPITESISPTPILKSHSRFSQSEDDQLRSVIRLYGQDNWELISEHIPGKNARQCKDRWLNYLSPDLNTHPWTDAEDCLLIRKYAEYGKHWVKIASFFQNRTDGMVKNRFLKLQRERKNNVFSTLFQHFAI
jgi:hypothetical protein